MSGAATVRANQAAVRTALRLFLKSGSVAELRILNTRHGTVAGYFDNLDRATEAAVAWDGKAPAIYVTANPVKRDLLARAVNRLEPYAKHTTSDADILCRRWFLVDCDPKRPPRISSTDTEHEAALALAREILATLSADEWPVPVSADSGNGAHLLWRVDLPNNDASRDLLKRCLETLAFRFDTEAVAVDQTTFNTARIWKVYGTLAKKGDNTPERPHRRAALLDVPEPLTVVPRELLEALAASAPLPRRPVAGHVPKKAEPLDVGAWCAAHGLSVAFSGPWPGGQKWILNPCPWNPEHTNRAAYIVQFPDGGIDAGCHHNGCAGKDWPALRDLVEAGWREREREARAAKTAATPQTADPAEEAAVVVCLADVRTEAVSWLWRGRYPLGKLSLLIGDPDRGKSNLLMDMAARVTTGRAWPDGSPCPAGDVVLLVAEDGLADTIKPRVLANGGDPSRIHVLTGIGDPKAPRLFSLAEDLEHLEALISRTKAILVGIDPVSAYMGGTKVNTFRDSDVRAVLSPVAALAERTRAALAGIMHLTKDQARQVMHRAQGNVSFVAAARAVFAVAVDPEDAERRLLLKVKLNIAEDPPGIGFRLLAADIPTDDGDVAKVCRVAWDNAPVTVDAQTALAGPEAPQERGEREEAKDFLSDLLAAGPVASEDVKRQARSAGIAERTLFRAKADLGVKAGKDGFEGPWFWSLTPKAAKAATSAYSGNGGNLGNLREATKPSAGPLPDLAAEEQLFRLWWKTLPDKPLARARGGDLAHWQRERGLSDVALAGLRARVRDLLEGKGK